MVKVKPQPITEDQRIRERQTELRNMRLTYARRQAVRYGDSFYGCAPETYGDLYKAWTDFLSQFAAVEQRYLDHARTERIRALYEAPSTNGIVASTRFVG